MCRKPLLHAPAFWVFQVPEIGGFLFELLQVRRAIPCRPGHWARSIHGIFSMNGMLVIPETSSHGWHVRTFL